MAKKIKITDYPENENELTVQYIGKFIRAKRTQSGLTSHQTALLCNVPVDVITKLENSSGGVTLDSFLKVVNGLSINIQFEKDGK
jgi:transcriptional regulator with XRE-family HTH domain